MCTAATYQTKDFYFIKDEYYKRFPKCGLMGNKDSDEAGVHGRPCFYCFETDGYFWMVPISSKTEKYKALYEEKKRDIRNMMVYDLDM